MLDLDDYFDSYCMCLFVQPIQYMSFQLVPNKMKGGGQREEQAEEVGTGDLPSNVRRRM